MRIRLVPPVMLHLYSLQLPSRCRRKKILWIRIEYRKLGYAKARVDTEKAGVTATSGAPVFPFLYTHLLKQLNILCKRKKRRFF